MPTFLHLPFELQSLILQSAFLDALDSDLSSHPVRPLSASPTYHPSLLRSSILQLGPMHQTTSIHDLFTQLLPLTISPAGSEASSDAGLSDSEDETPIPDTVEEEMVMSPNQLITCLLRAQRDVHHETEKTKVLMQDIVLNQPWTARSSSSPVAAAPEQEGKGFGERYGVLWRRKERAEIVGEVIQAALKVLQGLEEGMEMERDREEVFGLEMEGGVVV